MNCVFQSDSDTDCLQVQFVRVDCWLSYKQHSAVLAVDGHDSNSWQL